MVELVKTLGTTYAGPKVYVMTPPPLMSANSGWPTMQPTINTLFPKLIPLMQKVNPGVLGPIDVYGGMGMYVYGMAYVGYSQYYTRVI